MKPMLAIWTPKSKNLYINHAIGFCIKNKVNLKPARQSEHCFFAPNSYQKNFEVK
jgi:hypothetical protein